jgi:hypothetical protein
VKMVGSGPGEAIAETHLCMGKARGWLSTELPDRELGCYQDILARGSNEDQGKDELLDTSTKYRSRRWEFTSLSPFYLLDLFYVPLLCAYFSSLV